MLKKSIIALLCSLFACAAAFGVVACANGGGGGGSTTVPAPEISLQGNKISWSEVENATGYEVYENETLKQTVTETSYTIQAAGGQYSYTVKTVAEGGKSEASNAVSVTVLAAPTVTLQGERLTWTAVTGAKSYQVYVNGEADRRYGATATGHNITVTTPGIYSYTVVAESNEDGVVNSMPSAAAVYSIPIPVTVNAPLDYPQGSVTLKVYDGATEKATESVTLENGTGTAQFTLALQAYTVKAQPAQGYVANYGYITESSPRATVTIVEATPENTLNLNENQKEINGTEESPAVLVFTAQTAGIHSLVGAEGDNYTVTLNGATVISPATNLEIGNFTAEAGETVIFGVVGTGTFTLKVYDHDVPRPLKVSPHYYIEEQEQHPEVRSNILTGSCPCEITIETEGYYTFFFTTPTLGNRSVTVTIGEQTYYFDGSEHQKDIYFEACTNLQIQVVIEGEAEEGLNLALYVFPQGTIMDQQETT